ncbi:MAG: FG-GAP-like repeat-containing protein [Deltaproteobacteria bacterium]|nr:FG-GAP-like repeat-containing protein [Deltaproteobacteria bacterium]
MVVAVSSLDTAVATVGTAQLTFTASNYSSDQVLTLMAPDDADAAPGSTTLRLESVAAGLLTNVPVAVADDDHLTIETSVSAVTLAENGTATFTVQLGAQPPAGVMVGVVSSDLGAATPSPATLSFTTSNWNVAQTVTVTGVQDVDLNDESLSLTLTASGLPVKVVTATVNDDDAQGTVLSAATLTVSEGSTGTVGVSLQFMPTSDVTVTVASADPAVATAAPATLTFTSANYATPQLVTIGGVIDADAVDESTTVSLTSAGLATRTVAVTVTDIDHLGLEASVPSLSIGEGATGTVGVRLTAQPTLTFTTVNWHTYQNVTITGVQDADAADESVTITAASTGLTSLPIAVAVVDDEILGIVTDVTAVTLTEGATGTFQVRLAAQPAATTNVTVTSGDTGAATVAPATLMFTTANWNVYQTVTITGAQDVDLADETVTMTLASAGFPNRLVTATVTDNDTQVVVASASAVTVTEGSTINTLGVSLQYMPAGNVVVSVASADGAVATASPGSLTFTPANYAVAQTVSVTGTQDADAANGATSLSLTAAGATPATVTVNVTDDDILGIETSVGSLTVGEAGTGKVSVRLTAQPAGTTVVSIASSDTGAATVTGSLTFTTANWNVFQDANIAGVNDPDVANESVTLTLTSGALPMKTVALTVLDDDTLGIITTASAVSLGEAGTATFQVKLSAQPSANLSVAVGSSDTGAATVAPATLPFTTANWNTFQTVTVSGVGDLDLADETVTIALTNALVTTQNVTATVTDDDTQVVLVSANTLNITEGTTGSFTVSLKYVPSAPTTITLTSNNTAGATVSPASVVLDATNYATGSNVNVTGVQDADAANAAATITAAAGAASASVAVTVIDDDVLGVVTDLSSVSFSEGGSAQFQVRLTAQPAAGNNVVVAIASSDVGAVTVSAATTSLTFTSANWNAYQPVILNGVADQDLVNETVAIKLTSAAIASIPDVTANVTDDDTQVVQVSAPTLTVGEGASDGTIKVTLKFIPTAATMVSVASSDSTVASVTPATISLDATNYATGKPITITGVQDANTTNGAAVISATAGASSASIGVTVIDDDVLGVATDFTSVSLGEAGTGQFQVKLTAQPTVGNNVVISITSSDTGAVTVGTPSLTFTSANWSTYQPVTLNGVADQDLVNETVAIKMASAAIGSIPDVTANVVDDDMQALQVSANALTVPEGTTNSSVKVSLAFIPTAPTTITIGSNNTGAVTVTPASVTLDSSNYATGQIINVTGVEDANATDDSATISVSNAALGTKAIAVTVVDRGALTLVRTAGDNQAGVVSTALASPFVVTVRDAAWNPVPGVTVSFAVASGGGSLSATTVQTNAQGLAQTTLTLGASAGLNTVTATAPVLTGSPITFTATKLVSSTGTFRPQVSFAGLCSYAVAVGDLNSDGKPDVVLACSTYISVLLGTTATGATTPTFAPKVDFPSGPSSYALAIGDLNGDGKPDIAVANRTAASVSVFLNTTAGGALVPTFSAKVDFPGGPQPASVAIGDINGDGRLDLAVASDGVSASLRSTSVLLNTASNGASMPSFAAKVDFPSLWETESVVLSDLNQDGKVDLAFAGYSGASVRLNTTAPGAAVPTFSMQVYFTAGVSPISVAVGDINRDGAPDLVVANNNPDPNAGDHNYGFDQVSVFMSTTASGAAAPSYSPVVNFTADLNPSSVALGDLNGDGKLDFVDTNSNAGTVSVFLSSTLQGATAPTFAPKVDYGAGFSPYAVAVGDLNGDGRLDLAVASTNSDGLIVLLGQ